MTQEDILARLNKKFTEAQEKTKPSKGIPKYHVEFYIYKDKEWYPKSKHKNMEYAIFSAENAIKKHKIVRIIYMGGLKKLWINKKLIETKGMTEQEVAKLITGKK